MLARIPSDGSDDRLDEFGILEDSVRSQNHWLEEQSGGLRWRLDTFAFERDDQPTEAGSAVFVEAIDVTFIESSLPGSQLNSAFEVEEELTRHGLAKENKRYLSYVASDAGDLCGDSIYQIPLIPGIATDGKYAQVYLDGTPG